MSDHFIVPPGDELAFTQALVGEIINLEPICPLCGHQRASRVEVDREDPDSVVEVPCYLTWGASSGVTAACRDTEQMPPFRMIKNPDGAGHISAWRHRGVRCHGCRYISAASAFCRPTGPPYQGV